MSEMGDDVYQPDGSEVQDDEGVLEPEDTLVDRGVESALDEGYSPPEKPLGVESYGTTAAEQHAGEPLDLRLSRETRDTGFGEDGFGGDGFGGDGPGRGRTEGDNGIDGNAVDENEIDDLLIEEGTDVTGSAADDEPADEELPADEVPGLWTRAGRLVAPDEGTHSDETSEEVAADVGIDGAAASAEEAAVHITSWPGPPGEAGEPPPP